MAISHQAIPKFHGIRSGPNFTCVIMDFVEGQPLSKHIKEEQDPQAKDDLILIFLRDIGGVLAWLRDQNFVYRDMKPDNIMVLPTRERMMLVDFEYLGLRSRAEVALCTPNYVAPEVYQKCSLVGNPNRFGWDSFKAADWYGLGLVLYEVISKTPLFSPDDKSSQAHDRKWNGFPPETFDGMGKYAEVLKGLLNPSPRKRWQWKKLREWLLETYPHDPRLQG